MTNNFEIIKEFIKKVNPEFPQTVNAQLSDEYYVIYIIKRGKDNENSPASNKVVMKYTIYSLDDLDKNTDEIITICNALNARAYFHVNPKSKKQVALDAMAELAHRISTNDYKNILASIGAAEGQYVNRSKSVWIIDMDDITDIDRINELNDAIKLSCRSKYETAHIMNIKTRSGYHLLYKPFALDDFVNLIANNNKFIELFEGLQQKPSNISDSVYLSMCMKFFNRNIIKKNNPTLLYENVK